jgi:hypothetical protein
MATTMTMAICCPSLTLGRLLVLCDPIPFSLSLALYPLSLRSLCLLVVFCMPTPLEDPMPSLSLYHPLSLSRGLSSSSSSPDLSSLIPTTQISTHLTTSTSTHPATRPNEHVTPSKKMKEIVVAVSPSQKYLLLSNSFSFTTLRVVVFL